MPKTYGIERSDRKQCASAPYETASASKEVSEMQHGMSVRGVDSSEAKKTAAYRPFPINDRHQNAENALINGKLKK